MSDDAKMVFTDEKLERMKEDLSFTKAQVALAYTAGELKALLARLAAAELALEAHYTENDNFHSPDEAYEIWLRTRGK